MNTTIKRKLLIIAVLLLIVINITALITIFYNSRIKSKQTLNYNELQEKVQMNGMNQFFRDELNLSDDQFTLFQDINRNNMIKSQDIVQEMNELRFEMMNEISNANPDMKKLDQIAHEIGELHYKLKLNTINHFIELKGICNNDQQQVLQKMFIHMIQDQDGDRGNMRRRNQYGRGRRNGPPSHKRN